MDRVFLDANVLFSAAYSSGSKLSLLWGLADATLVTSSYAVDEATRNLTAEQNLRLEGLLEGVEVVSLMPVADLPAEASALPEKDRPILAAAISLGATHLLTGDASHFGSLYDKEIGGVMVMAPGRYLSGRR